MLVGKNKLIYISLRCFKITVQSDLKNFKLAILKCAFLILIELTVGERQHRVIG